MKIADEIFAVRRREVRPEDGVDQHADLGIAGVRRERRVLGRRPAVVVVLVAQRDQHFVEERIAHAIDLHERALAQRLPVREPDRDARTRHRRVDADAGLRPEERALVVEARQLLERNLDRVREHVEALEAVDAVPA